MGNPSITALLPMKGHSERIPGKNLKVLGNKPLFFWILETLTEISDIHRIIINTDDSQIAALAVDNFDVIIHERDDSLIGDFVSMNRIISSDLTQTNNGDYFLQTHSTNPFLQSSTIEKAIKCLFENNGKYDSLFSVTRRQSRFYDTHGTPLNHDPSSLARTQDILPLLEENSCLYLFSRRSFAATHTRIGASPFLFETEPLESTDIDDPRDWRLAEQLVHCGMFPGGDRR